MQATIARPQPTDNLGARRVALMPPTPVGRPRQVGVGGALDPDLLRRAALLRALPPEDRARLAALLQPRSYQRGEVVFRHGDVGETAHLVLQGRLKIVLPSHHGREASLAII